MITVLNRPGPSLWAWGSPAGEGIPADTGRRSGKITRPINIDIPDVLTGLVGLALLTEWMRSWR